MLLDNLLPGDVESARQLASIKTCLLCYKVENKSPATIEWLRGTLTDFFSFTGLRDATQISPYHIRAFLAHLKDRGLKPSSINNRYRALHRFCEWLKEEGLITKSPFVNIKPPKVPQVLIPVFTKEHIERLLYLCPPNRFIGARNRAMLWLLLSTGIRVAELAGLNIQDIDLERAFIRVTGKGNKMRQIHLPKMAALAMLNYLRYRWQTNTTNRLWLSEERRPMTLSGIKLTIARLGQHSGIKDVRVSPHTFRHTFAITYLRQHRGTLRHLQEIMGHSSLEPLQVYLRMIDAEDAAKTMSDFNPLDGLR